MRIVKVYGLTIALLVSLCLSFNLTAKEYFVENKQAYQNIAQRLKAGDTVTLKNGVWENFEILLSGQGTESAPITLTAETKGGVIISGQSNLRLAGQYLVVSGLVFKNGYTPTSAVIEFRRNKNELAFNSRVTEIVIDNFNNPDKQESDYWVALYGQHNRLDHSHIVGKRNKGVTVAVRLNNEESQQNYHRLDHNYFGYRPTFGSNGGETLRIGTSHYSLTDSHTLVENNYFEHTNGEVEIISIKSGKNIIRNNTFFEARGTLTMRHGNGNLIEENVFIGNNVPHTGGIRVINRDQFVRNNYLEGLTGYRFGSGFTVMNGVPDSPINRYHQVDNATIENNTFADVQHIHLAAGSDAERSAPPVNSVFRNNLIINTSGKHPFSVFDDISGITFSNNLINQAPPADIEYGFKRQEIALQRNDSGLLTANGKAGASSSLQSTKKSQTGVSWYPKKAPETAFGSGRTHQVEASASALLMAIDKAQDGDTLELASGHYIVPKLIVIDKTLTVKARHHGKAKLSFERTALFEIRDGGNLSLHGLSITGQYSPDAAGNSVIRSQKWGMLNNYRFVMTDSTVSDLNINHSFNFFTTGKGAFADQITLVNNTFNQVTGDILSLDSEIEDLGIYNAEYVTLTDNTFSQIQGAIVKLYRGGTDESTFGPHFDMTGNTVDTAGNGKRNKRNASLFLHGVQVTNIANNEVRHSAPVKVEHTVGEPITSITNNVFEDTSAPQVEELRMPGPHTATLHNNRIVASEKR
ncbi:polysaccharide lyase 6 family protein [uncultured Alteromonas sp.]|uniref:polysaccharide lyase 6 family protein n=1 Tax=uncultured Alteromonas sp. TaxID=179113 RepID=UPI0025ECA813|nr:polysaccharide lyase 6 family protein [uncultured Alteromonas sp.]